MLLKKEHKTLSKQTIEKAREKLGDAYADRIESNSDAVRVTEIDYKSNNKSIRGYVVEPKDTDKTLPTIIFNRGGSGEFGSIRPARCFDDIADLARHGYVVFCSNYAGGLGSEGEDDFGGPETMQNVFDLKQIIDQWETADDANIGLYGESRGGIMACKLLRETNWIKATALVSPAVDEVSAPTLREGWEEHQMKMYGSTDEKEMAERRKDRSAVYWLEKMHKAPLLLMCGLKDWRVSPKSITKFAEKLREIEYPVECIAYKNAGHSLKETGDKWKKEIHEWFNKHLHG